ncbi:MAG: aminoglycoside phosphotransferase family protein [Chloroflexota bacterium]
MITIPEEFVTSTITREGETGRQWLDDLPQMVADLCSTWGLTIDGPVMHGYVGIVVPVLQGTLPCVLKVSWIDESSVDDAQALALWDGNGAVRVLDVNPSQGAMLLERLDYGHSLEDVEIGEAVTVAGQLLRRLAIPAPLDTGLRTEQTVAAQMMDTMPVHWETYGRPMSRQVLDEACELARVFRDSSMQTPLLVNYDLTYEDTLVGTREPWLVIDPKVIVGAPEYGIAQLLWCGLDDMQATKGLAYYFDMLVEAGEFDDDLARRWSFVRCVEYWLWGLTVGLTYDPVRCEVIVDWLQTGKT